MSNMFSSLRLLLPAPAKQLLQTGEQIFGSEKIQSGFSEIGKKIGIVPKEKKFEDEGLFDSEAAMRDGYSVEEVRNILKETGRRSTIPLTGDPVEPSLLDREGREIVPQQTNAPFFPPKVDEGIATGAEARHLPLTPSGHESYLEDWIKEFPRRAANFGIQSNAAFVEGLTGLPDLLLPGTPLTDVTKKYFTQPVRDIANREFGETPESYSTKAGNILGTFGAMLPSIGAAAKIAAPVVGALGKIPYAGGPLGFLTKSAATTTGALAPTTGEFPTKEEIGIGLLIDTVFAGFGRAFGPQKMQHKAMGLSGEIDKKLSKIVRSVKDSNGKPIYESIDDFALKNNISGSRAEMVEKAKELFQEAKASKVVVLKNIKTMTNVDDLFKKLGNSYDDFIAMLLKHYNEFGTQNQFKAIQKFVGRKRLSAIELEKLRLFADEILPPSAYRAVLGLGTEPIKLKGLEQAINLFRNRLADIDPSGTIRKLNLHKRILNSATEQASKSLTSALEATKGRDMLMRGGIRSAIGGAGGYGLATLFPSIFGGGTAAAALPAIYEAVTSIPQVSSEIAKIGVKSITPSALASIFSKLGFSSLAKEVAKVPAVTLSKTLSSILPSTTKGALRGLVPRVETEEEKAAKLEQEDRLRRIQEQQERMLR